MNLLDSTKMFVDMFVAQTLLRFEHIHVDRRRNRHRTRRAEEQGRIQCEKKWEQHNEIYECGWKYIVFDIVGLRFKFSRRPI